MAACERLVALVNEHLRTFECLYVLSRVVGRPAGAYVCYTMLQAALWLDEIDFFVLSRQTYSQC